jgi:hypothetical protein
LFAPSVLWKQKGFIFMQRKSILANSLQLETEGVTITDLAFFKRTAWLQRDLG